ncbi:MAG: MarR family transcriptional regulator [Thermaerobacter sp.]|nr:MarR family transcriptional regulator [Thermaerobacter sp.]
MDREELAVELQKVIRQIQMGFRSQRPGGLIRPGEMRALWVIAHHGPLEKSELAAALGITKPLVTSLVRRLEELALITQTIPESDRRRRILFLSARGQEALDEVKNLRRERMREVFARLTADEQDQLYALLVKLRGPADEDSAFASQPPARCHPRPHGHFGRRGC